MCSINSTILTLVKTSGYWNGKLKLTCLKRVGYTRFRPKIIFLKIDVAFKLILDLVFETFKFFVHQMKDRERRAIETCIKLS